MIVIRACAGFEELAACVRLQVETWGYDEADVIPRRAFLVAQKIGGQVIGAFDTEIPGSQPNGSAESLVGFALSLPGVKARAGGPLPYLHSHMLAVKAAYRDRGLGMRLKLEQRREALARGIQRIEWTFDPLEIKNAFLNIHKLGATARDYRVNFYGVSSSQLQGGLPTDRLLAEWRLDSPRVKAVLDERPAVAQPIEERIQVRIQVPASIHRWKASESGRERAVAVQLENRKKFQQAFSQGLAVLGFSLDAEGNGVFELGFPTPAELD
ncbi:MAG: GNAT family N-acetyltransferase [Terracidiphilus sp.]|jgi:predicted GNAT superfamily acetyltransferase